MWKALIEGSVLSTMKQVTPSDRSDVSSNQGIGDRSDVGKDPSSGQSKIWGNLDKQSRGMEGKLDTQGSSDTKMFTSNEGNTQKNETGTVTPNVYKQMYAIKENANAGSTGVMSGKVKSTAAAGSVVNPMVKHAEDADTTIGGSTNICDCKRKPSTITESDLFGVSISLIASKLVQESFGIKTFKKNKKVK